MAASRAGRAAQQLDEYWYHMRVRDTELPGKHRLRVRPDTPYCENKAARVDTVTLSDAVAIYLKVKGVDRPKTFRRAAERSCGYVIDVVGDKDLRVYTKKDANAFRDQLIERGLSGSSITRIMGTVRSVTNFAASEMELRPNDIIFIAEQPITKWNRVLTQLAPNLVTSTVASAVN